MSVQVVYKNKFNSRKFDTIVVFADEKYKFKSSLELLSKKENIYLTGILKNKHKNNREIFTVNISNNKTVIVVILKKSKNTIDFENAGAKFYEFTKKNLFSYLYININNFVSLNEYSNLNHFIHGFKLKSYKFDAYKSKKDKKLITIQVSGLRKKYNEIKFKALEEGIFLTRDLVSEPGNILHPDEYSKRLSNLKKYGLKVTVYDKKKLKKLGCRALLGVGQGSIRGSYIVTIEWKGIKSKAKPLSFVGKGVCFDTGGISLKPAKFMEDMTYDMAGSAVVVGLMKNLAIRKAKVNVVGVVGLVENMPGGNAQRPGDIVKSYSGKTIEVLNTDAEGRLVLADAMAFTEKNLIHH